MKLTYTTANGRISFEVEVATGKIAFECIAAIQEVFEEPSCGLCDGKSIRYEVREFNKKRYFKLVCTSCNGQLDVGQNQDGKGVFLKRKDKEGNHMDNHGWYIYKGAN